MKILECIPNVSEGRNPKMIRHFTEVISSVNDVQLLHQDSGYAAHRTVYTFAGKPEAVLEAAFRLYMAAWEHLDMSTHQGTHPRQGAIDVCPLVPLQGMNLEEASKYARQLAERLTKNIGVPGYYYEANASSEERRNLAFLRKGEYESLPAKFTELLPDFGKADLWRKNGVTVIGARKLLVAYNVNLDTKDVSIARSIATAVRESGRLIQNKDGSSQRKAGSLKSVKAIGWYIRDFDKVQVSYNLTKLSENGILETFLQTVLEAGQRNCRVTGSELIGLAPLSEFIKVQAYLRAHNRPDSLSEAIDFLGLGELHPFDPEKKIIELILK